MLKDYKKKNSKVNTEASYNYPSTPEALFLRLQTGIPFEKINEKNHTSTTSEMFAKQYISKTVEQRFIKTLLNNYHLYFHYNCQDFALFPKQIP